jgi:hypothetical protein
MIDTALVAMPHAFPSISVRQRRQPPSAQITVNWRIPLDHNPPESPSRQCAWPAAPPRGRIAGWPIVPTHRKSPIAARPPASKGRRSHIALPTPPRLPVPQASTVARRRQRADLVPPRWRQLRASTLRIGMADPRPGRIRAAAQDQQGLPSSYSPERIRYRPST